MSSASPTPATDGHPRYNFYTNPFDTSAGGRRLFTEVLGTFFLTLVAAGSDVINAVTGDQISRSAAVVAPALVVIALIYTMGDVSGAHFNPVVTVAFAIRADFPWRRVPAYIVAQTLGAICAAGLLRVMFGDVGRLGATLPGPHVTPFVAFVMEVILTCLLVTVILGTAHDTRLVGHNAALAVGATIALTGLFASPISGASMNPARSFGPALVSLNLGTYWIYLFGPALGALLATGIARILHGMTTEDARRAATGH